MVQCFVPYCNHQSESHHCSFFRFPKELARLKRWKTLIRRADRDPNANSRVCSCHFRGGEKKNDPEIFQWTSVKLFPLKPEAKKRKITKKSFLSAAEKLCISLDQEPNSEVVTIIEKKHQISDRRSGKRRKTKDVKNQDNVISSSSVTEFEPSIPEIQYEQNPPSTLKLKSPTKKEMDEVMLSPVGDILSNVQKLAHSKFLSLSKSVKLETQNCHLKEVVPKVKESFKRDEPISTSNEISLQEQEKQCTTKSSFYSAQRSDYAEFFGNMIAQRLRNLCPIKCAEAQVKMLQALINVENSHLNDLELESTDDVVPMASDHAMNDCSAEGFMCT